VLQKLGESVSNTNGRGYLLESALERSGPVPELPEPQLSDGFVEAIPVPLLFDILAQRLIPERAMETHESVVFEFEDRDDIIVTVRHGVAEVAEGQPLPGTPEPVATVHTSSTTWRRIALQKTSPIKALAAGELSVEGDRAAFLAFMQRFRRGL
jgi:alkyl sulfatase BDS1-like metallo-beta-lactamase superfamily hydrolase